MFIDSGGLMTFIRHHWRIADGRELCFVPKKVIRRLLRVTNWAVPVMDTQQPPRRLPKIKFRVLIIGRANAGKTSILQRVCDTTESPVVYRRKGSKKERVRCPSFIDSACLVSPPHQIQLDPSREVSDRVPFVGYY